MNRYHQRFEVRDPGLAGFVRALGCDIEFGRRRKRFVDFEKRFHVSEVANVTPEMKTQIRCDARAEKNVITEIVDAEL